MRFAALLLLVELAGALRLPSRSVVPSVVPVAISRVDSHVAMSAAAVEACLPAAALEPLTLCRSAAKTKAEDSDAVIDALLVLEKECRATSKADDGALSRATLAALNGAWRLVFTTGTVDMQNKLGGKINYFPIRATQTFDTSTMDITNGAHYP